MNRRKFAFLLLFALTMISSASAEIKHLEMRVEGMT
jgi:hypothetical protein